MSSIHRRRFLGTAFASAAVLALGPAVARAAKDCYVEWTKYKKILKTGEVTAVKSGKDGPFDRQEAQSRVDRYKSKGGTGKRVQYYYLAKIVN
jgi:hypothetical protein